MKKFYLIIIILLNSNLEGISQTQIVDLQPSYANQSFFSLENGEILNTFNTDWDLAFSTSTMSSSIRINALKIFNVFINSVKLNKVWYLNISLALFKGTLSLSHITP